MGEALKRKARRGSLNRLFVGVGFGVKRLYLGGSEGGREAVRSLWGGREGSGIIGRVNLRQARTDQSSLVPVLVPGAGAGESRRAIATSCWYTPPV